MSDFGPALTLGGHGIPITGALSGSEISVQGTQYVPGYPCSGGLTAVRDFHMRVAFGRGTRAAMSGGFKWRYLERVPGCLDNFLHYTLEGTLRRRSELPTGV